MLAAYGQVLMTKRFLNRVDSESLQGLYGDLAQTEALASWMAAEYRSASPQNPEAFRNIMTAYLGNTKEEQENLPRLIPAGAVIDLGKVNSITSSGKPIWFPASTEDLGWLPKNVLPSPYGTFATNEVGAAIANLNNPKLVGKVRGTDWRVPTAVQMTALLSEGCGADPANPKQYVKGPACKNAVAPKTGATVGGCLLNLNREDSDWLALFCQTIAQISCAPGVGPGPAGAPPHAFVWTSEAVGQKMKCGWSIIPSSGYSRAYTIYTGFDTGATGPAWSAYPPLPGKVPGCGFMAGHLAYATCDYYFFTQTKGIASKKIPPSPWSKGVVLATRNTGAADLNPVNGIDYMAQKPQQCAGQAATIVGTTRRDKIEGTPGRDVIVALQGNDLIRGLGAATSSAPGAAMTPSSAQPGTTS